MTTLDAVSRRGLSADARSASLNMLAIAVAVVALLNPRSSQVGLELFLSRVAIASASLALLLFLFAFLLFDRAWHDAASDFTLTSHKRARTLFRAGVITLVPVPLPLLAAVFGVAGPLVFCAAATCMSYFFHRT
jgi:hypothetical protein